MRVFITGIAGFLGSHLAKYMINRGHHVCGCDNLSGGYLDNVPDGAVFYAWWDCCSLAYMNNIIRENEVDTVFHCAASAYEGLSVFSPARITKDIVQASVSVISAAISNKVKRFIYASSMARYGNNDVPFTEDMQPKPQDPYGIGKVAGEDILRNLAELHGMEYIIAVPHNIIGPGQKYDDPFRNVASIFINMMLQGRQPFIYGDGKQMRCFTHVDDNVSILYKLGMLDGLSGEIFNIGPDSDYVTVQGLAELTAELLDFDLDPIYVGDRPREVKYANCSANKAREFLGYNPEKSLGEGITDIISYIKYRGVRDFEYHLPVEIKNELTPKTWLNRMF